MKPIHHPPDIILRAYAALLNQVFLFLRGRSHSRDGINKDEIHDLADALHNISCIIADYGTWTDDQKYREFYLRPYDKKWAKGGLGLEAFLDEKIKEFSKE